MNRGYAAGLSACAQKDLSSKRPGPFIGGFSDSSDFVTTRMEVTKCVEKLLPTACVDMY